MLQTDWMYRRNKPIVLNLRFQINCSSLSILVYHISCYGLSVNGWLISSYAYPFIRWLAVCSIVRMSPPAYITRFVQPYNYCNHVLQLSTAICKSRTASLSLMAHLADWKGLFGSCWLPLCEGKGPEARAPVTERCANLWWLNSFNIWYLLKTLIHN
jgi:hypothetical protein